MLFSCFFRALRGLNGESAKAQIFIDLMILRNGFGRLAFLAGMIFELF